MRLAQFISQNAERITHEWEKFAATILPAGRTMTLEERTDHIAQILRRVTEDLGEPETPQQQQAKAKGQDDASQSAHSAADSHGSARAESGYTPDQMVSEFRALRACVVRLWLDDAHADHSDRDSDDMMRFHEAIDQALAESVRSFTRNVDRAKDLFLGVLGHDLRTPLGAVMMGATVMMTEEGADWRHAKTASRILRSCMRMEEIIGDLLDFTRGRLGGGIPIVRSEMDLEALLRQNIDELAGVEKRGPIALASSGPTVGNWDRARLGQVMANLIGNACQHGAAGQPIEVSLGLDGDVAVVAVRNRGTMIPAQHLQDIFEPFRRLGAIGQAPRSTSSLGLGLFIAKAIVAAHRGTVEVSSTQEATTFTVRLPRYEGTEESSGAPPHASGAG